MGSAYSQLPFMIPHSLGTCDLKMPSLHRPPGWELQRSSYRRYIAPKRETVVPERHNRPMAGFRALHPPHRRDPDLRGLTGSGNHHASCCIRIGPNAQLARFTVMPISRRGAGGYKPVESQTLTERKRRRPSQRSKPSLPPPGGAKPSRPPLAARC